jgi:tetratricopeptide (TPR) repeat protein
MTRPDDIYSESKLSEQSRSFKRRRREAHANESGQGMPRRSRHGRRRHTNPIRRDSAILALTILLVVAGVYLFLLLRSLKAPLVTPSAPRPDREGTPRPPTSGDTEIDLMTANRVAQLRANMVLHRQALTRAYEHIQAGRGHEAQERVDVAKRMLPESTATLKAQAEIHLLYKDYNQAIPVLLDVLEREPEDLGVRVAMAGALIAGRQDEAALTLTEWILDSQPYTIEARHLAAVANLNLNRLQASVLHLKKILEIDSQYRPALNLLVLTHRRQNDQDAVIKLCREQLAQGNQDSSLYFNLAVAHAMRNEPGHAVEWLRKAQELFGSSYVRNWLNGGDFESIRESMVYRDLLQQLNVADD